MTAAPAGRPAVDAGTDVATGLGYGDVSGFGDLAAGSYAVSVRPAGSSPATAPALSARVEVPAEGARTLALSGGFADLTLSPLPDDPTAPATGTARVRVVAAAGGAAALDVAVVGGPVLASGLSLPAVSDYTPVPAGSVVLRLAGATGATDVPVDVVAGTVVSLLVLDTPGGGLTVRPLIDATAPAVVPAGAVEAGGSAPPPARFPRLVATPAPPAPGAVPPVRVRAPAAGVDAPVTGTGLDAGGGLAVPADASVAGWYVAGPSPGQPGPAVLTAHVDWAGAPGAFAGLDRLAPGDVVVVDHADGTSARFAVDRVARVSKSAFPTGEVYGPAPGSELRLITCGGSFDPVVGSYADDVVVFARLIG
ncbi:Sortase family protein [Blastococcus aggregatus]|uniref:Sortase family protein n=1 Tax=Blastococcus aggregatus TaxID=38502 RepID=A0A285V3W0_9ACTN|nr:Sortase family protein [Blastococcus aggregatus]